METYELLMLLAAIVTAMGGVGFVVVMLKTYKGQMNAQIFTHLNQRFDDILKDFPKEAWEARFNLDTVLPPSSPELTFCAYRYFNLSSEEFYLYKRNYVHRDVWEIWESELLRNLRSPLFQREWKILASEFVSHPEFFRFVEEAQRSEASSEEKLLQKELHQR